MMLKRNNVRCVMYYDIMLITVIFDRLCCKKPYISSLCINGSCRWMSSFTVIIWGEDVNCLPLFDLVLEVEFSWERVSLFRYLYLPIYPAMNISYLPLPICSGNFNRFRASALSSHHRNKKIHIQDILAIFISLYCSISYRTYCGCTFCPEENKILYVWKLSYWIYLSANANLKV